MIDFGTELSNLASAQSDAPHQAVTSFVVQIDVLCSGDALGVLERVRGLLGTVIRHRLERPPDDEVEPEPFEVDQAYWAAVLPSWFLARTPFTSAVRSGSGWTVESWLYWFLSAHEDRDWRWVSATVASSTRIVAGIEVSDLPLAWDALRWAFLAAGAESARL